MGRYPVETRKHVSGDRPNHRPAKTSHGSLAGEPAVCDSDRDRPAASQGRKIGPDFQLEQDDGGGSDSVKRAAHGERKIKRVSEDVFWAVELGGGCVARVRGGRNDDFIRGQASFDLGHQASGGIDFAERDRVNPHTGLAADSAFDESEFLAPAATILFVNQHLVQQERYVCDRREAVEQVDQPRHGRMILAMGATITPYSHAAVRVHSSPARRNAKWRSARPRR